MHSDINYLVVTTKSWNVDFFHKFTPRLPGRWHLITSGDKFTLGTVTDINPRYIFFPHWSYFVPSEITDRYECVCFHMTDVPYGRGGSPLQNLILRGYSSTKLSALRMKDELDAGPVYTKDELKLDGSAEDIYKNSGQLCYQQIQYIIENEPEPIEQDGTIVLFNRRKPDQSSLPVNVKVDELYDFIRMLDADTYPHAFIQHGSIRLEFTSAGFDDDGVLEAKVRFVEGVE